MDRHASDMIGRRVSRNRMLKQASACRAARSLVKLAAPPGYYGSFLGGFAEGAWDGISNIRNKFSFGLTDRLGRYLDEKAEDGRRDWYDLPLSAYATHTYNQPDDLAHKTSKVLATGGRDLLLTALTAGVGGEALAASKVPGLTSAGTKLMAYGSRPVTGFWSATGPAAEAAMRAWYLENGLESAGNTIDSWKDYLSRKEGFTPSGQVANKKVPIHNTISTLGYFALPGVLGAAGKLMGAVAKGSKPLRAISGTLSSPFVQLVAPLAVGTGSSNTARLEQADVNDSYDQDYQAAERAMRMANPNLR